MATDTLAEKQAPPPSSDPPLQNGAPTQNGTSTQDGTSTQNDISEKASPPVDDPPKKKGPAGGFDSTPIPHAPPGYTVKFTFHSARNLPIADLGTLSSDPYIEAQLYTGLATRHKEDSPMRLRTPTIRRNTNPDWECQWIVANVPATGFRIKARVYDEDPADSDDRLGNAHIHVSSIDEKWGGIDHMNVHIRKRMGSKRAYLLRFITACIDHDKHIGAWIIFSAEVLGRTEGSEGGRAYTVGPQWWTRHYSPLLGRITGTKDEAAEDAKLDKKRRLQRYNFQANQMQLRGPVPADLYHRFVEFRPFVKAMFTASGIGGYILSYALHHQHNHVYNYNRSTVYGSFPEPSPEMTRQFLDLVHHDKGGRIFTYILTLDGCLRFTETGKEFGIDMLSKHTMHSDVSVYIAYSGEFFVRRVRRHPHRHHHHQHTASGTSTGPSSPQSPDGGPLSSSEILPPSADDDVEPPHDPASYELIIDNDSGTYRPNSALLPQLRAFLEANFPGLKITTLDCVADAERQQRLKKQQRERKADSGQPHLIFTQFNPSSSSLSSISSSDESALDHLERTGLPRQKTYLALAQDTILGRTPRQKKEKLRQKRLKDPPQLKTNEIPTGMGTPATAGPSTPAAV